MNTSLAPRLILGQTLQLPVDPFVAPPTEGARHDRHGAILVEAGRVAALGSAESLRAAHPQAEVEDMGEALLLPGFIDAHTHFPQTAMIASWGKRLIDWLNTYTFPEEARFHDPAYSATIAARYFDLTLAHGTTTTCSYATSHPVSVEAYFTEARRRGLRAVAGKTCMDRNAPDNLRDTAQSAYDDSKALLERWHGVDRLEYAITPRFTPTSSREQLHALGALWGEYPDCLMQTHLSEQVDEVAWVRDLHPQARDYLDTYEAADLLGPRGLYGHSIYLEPREVDRIAEVGAALVHCPTSNTFVGSGVFAMAAMKARGIPVGLATDTGGGSSFSMLRTMAAAYEIGQLAGTALHPAQLLWLATAGSARAMHMDDKIGTLAVGSEADIVALDLGSTPAIAQRLAEADDIWDAVFPTIMMGDDRAIAGVWVAGKRC
ncbi:guanine deaminase [Oceaniglobus trochenteri]|uniref:guanine deaminase n=1 Tax=Oceaniglobus trochenteri TaxID=2763260 RepID=UPI001CFF64D1|nr:guanine deaminase [Oceaniglobus trochenteri]